MANLAQVYLILTFVASLEFRSQSLRVHDFKSMQYRLIVAKAHAPDAFDLLTNDIKFILPDSNQC
jgi:hypothetical protein